MLRALAGLLDHVHNGKQEGALLLDEQPATVARRRVAFLQPDLSCSLVQSQIGADVAFGPPNTESP